MQEGYRLRCYPDIAQELILPRRMDCQQFIYNSTVQKDRYFNAFGRKSLQQAGQFALQDQNSIAHTSVNQKISNCHQSAKVVGEVM